MVESTVSIAIAPAASRGVRVDASESGSTWRLGKLIAACFDDV